MSDFSSYEYVSKGEHHFSYRSPECSNKRGDFHVPHGKIQKWIDDGLARPPECDYSPPSRPEVNFGFADDAEKEIALLKETLKVAQRYHRNEGQYDYSVMADAGQQMGEDWEFIDELIKVALK